MTAEELFWLPEDSHHYELIYGELRKMSPPGSEHGMITVNLTILLGLYVRAHGLGIVLTGESGFLIGRDPDTVRAPDVAFIRRDRIPPSGIPTTYWPGPPDLVVEVISPGDTYLEVEEKVAMWLEAGATMVWVVNPRRRIVVAHRSLTDITVLTEDGMLDGGEVIPGFRCRVADIFVV